MKRTSLKIRPCDIVLWLPYMCLKEDSRNRRKERLFWENNGKLIKRRRNGVLYDRFFLSLVKEDGTVSSARLGLIMYVLHIYENTLYFVLFSEVP